MAKQHGIAGEWARVRGTVLSLWPLFLSFILMGAFLSALFTSSNTWIFGILFIASLISVFVYWKKGLRRIESFFRGARGEERVANVLSNLPDTYHVFNDFAVGGDYVDHVVVGPAGVFSIETKSWRGEVDIEDGHVLVNKSLPSRNPIIQAQHEADKVRLLIKKLGFDISVIPVVCFASDTFVSDLTQCGPVKILNSDAIQNWFTLMPEVLPLSEVARLVQLVETRK